MKYAPTEDRKGRPLRPGDRVRFKTYPRGTREGIVEISPRKLVVMPDGSTLPALVINAEGTTYPLITKGVLKLSSENTMQKIASPQELQAEIRAIMAFIHNSEKPDRRIVADKLRALASRVAEAPRQAAGGSFLLGVMKESAKGLPRLLEQHPKVHEATAAVRAGRMLVQIVWTEDVYEAGPSEIRRLTKEVLGPKGTGDRADDVSHAIYELPGS